MTGFHLIEVLITLTIIIIVAAIGIPTYSHYFVYEKRLEAVSTLSQLSIAMEHFYIEHNTYNGANFGTVKNGYKFHIQSANAHEYVLTATPQGQQAENDAACGTLAISSLGEKSISGSGKIDECW